MRELSIECGGVSDMSVRAYKLKLELEDVDMSFLEEVPAEIVCQNKNIYEILDYIGCVEICDYLEDKYGIKIEER